MAQGADNPRTIRVRGSRTLIDTTRDKPGRSGLQEYSQDLDRQLPPEEDDSVSLVGQALAEISHGGDLAHLDGRLTFAERQIERLASRREESDWLISSELAVMRARLEDTLSAFAAATQEHREVMAASERRLLSLVSEAERHSLAMVESLRLEVSGQVDEVGRGKEHLEARLVGEKRVIAEEAAKRATALSDTIVAGRQLVEAQLNAALAKVDARAEAALGELDAVSPEHRASILAEVEARLDEWLEGPLEEVERLKAGLAAATSAQEQVSQARLELEGLLIASEDNALRAMEQLEARVAEVRRRLVSDEAEWGAVVAEAGDAMDALLNKVEDLLGRVCSLEAVSAAERGRVGARLDAIDGRLELHDEGAEASMDELAQVSRRLAVLEAELAPLERTRQDSDEHSGSIDYLTQRVHQLSEQLEEAASWSVGRQAQAIPAAGGGMVGAAGGSEAGLDGLDARWDELVRNQDLLARRLAAIEEYLLASEPSVATAKPAPESANQRRRRSRR